MNEKKIMKLFRETAYVRMGGSAEELRCAEYLKEQVAALGMEASYREILHILQLMGQTDACPVYRGSEAWLPDEATPVLSEAARDLCRRAMEYSPEEVATITQPISSLARPLSKSAFFAASMASVVAFSPSPQK